MNYQRFIHAFLQELSYALPPDLLPQIQLETKNNDDRQEYIVFVPASAASAAGIYPSLALQPLYVQFCQGRTFPQLVSDVLELLSHTETAPGIAPEQFEHFEDVKQHLCLKLINKANNTLLLQDTPYIDYYDLALVCIFFQATPETSVVSSALIRKPCLDMWKIDQKTLFAHATQNTQKLMQPNLFRMDQVLLQNPNLTFSPEIGSNMYVLTNNHHYLGAVCMTFPGVLEQLARELDSDLILIPSSIHEIIIIPESGNPPQNLDDIIVSVNQEAVHIQERLSDHSYHYDRIQKRLVF
jgi:hypothetical protein